MILIIYSSLSSILFLVNGLLVMNSLSFKNYNDFGLLMNYSFTIYLYFFESIIYLDSIFYLGFPYSALFLNVGLNGVSNLVLDNSLFILAILFSSFFSLFLSFYLSMPAKDFILGYIYSSFKFITIGLTALIGWSARYYNYDRYFQSSWV